MKKKQARFLIKVKFQVKLTDIENMDLTTKRGHLTIKLQVHGENCKVMLRSGQDTKTWFDMIMVNSALTYCLF